ncbi:insulinase family protein [Christensenellaceae bacterium OttesenSCG-928-L17]|nr:insulinase family protein [Christensenellaceae bacterium OttesenSCG-928-L17]
MIIRETQNNGIRVVAETMEQVRSCAIGVWMGTGSANEMQDEAGISHFIEHMLFKGTATRSAQDIAAEMDSIGGNINAFTSKECTCYYVKVLDEHIDKAVDILADIVQHSTLSPEEIAKEQGVVAEEILMVEDTPEDLAHERVATLYYQEDPLAKPILGTEASVRSFNRDKLQRYMRRQYVGERIVIAVAGRFCEAQLLPLLQEKFAFVPAGEAPKLANNRAPGGRRFEAVEKDIEQIHICMALPGTFIDSIDQYPLFVLSNALGGSMSSRLFQRIREERGLAYSVYSYPSCYATTGSFAVYAGTGEQQAVEVTRLIMEELREISRNGITNEEFVRCRDQLKGSYLLGQEGTSSRMSALGKSELLLRRQYNEEENIRRIEAITMDDIMRIIPTVLDVKNMSTVCVGRISRQEAQLREMLQA